ncbi:hypothetical protein GCM10027034_29340 [Ramlibacter solisilvae]|uniref:Uncharacterized protein n=1 Tax=Ramlibacter tataouinensis TaxID=94132 RepID=A0A127JWW4_9BURK|nr:hypothetical protein UC35_06075 [Ramlibacter tataouinensis]
MIRQRLARADAEIGSSRLVTIVSAVEGLARSLLVHAPGRPPASAHFRYQQVRLKNPVDLVDEVFRLYAAKSAPQQLGEDTWNLFELATKFSNLVVHECTHLGQDKYLSLTSASERVLEELVEVAGLLRVVTPAAA